MVWYGLGLGVWVPARSLFHDKKFAFFDFGVRGTPKILKNFLGVPPKILKNCGFCLAPRRGLPAAEVGCGAKRHSRPEPRAKPLRGDQVKPPLFSKFSSETLRKISNFGENPNPPTPKSYKNPSVLGRIANIDKNGRISEPVGGVSA